MILSFSFMSKPTIVNASQVPTTFVKGADVGWLPQMEASNFIFKDDNGNQQDCLQILKDHGINSIRLRTWVNPSNDPQSGHCSTQETVNMAVRAKNMGFKIMIDFHYSDSWTDPGQQNIPAVWKNDDLTQMTKHLYDYTYDVMEQLKDVGVAPEWVQVGNEINPGMLLPMGSIDNPSNLVQLINSGYDAVKAISPTSKVIIHRSNGFDNHNFRNFFDTLKANNAKYDIIGVSCYPGNDYTATVDALGDNLIDMASRYGKEVMVVETGADCSVDEVNVHNMLIDMQNKVLAVPDGKGIGVFYWEPEGAKSWSGYSWSAWNGHNGTPNDGKPTKALDAFLPGEVELNPYPVTGILLDKENVDVEVGNTVSVNATLTPSNSTYKGIVFSSSDERIAKVNSSNGIVTGMAPGTVTITATSYDQHKTATCKVTVVPSSNLIANPDFELNQESWTVTGNIASITFGNDSHKGAKALHYYNGDFEVSQTITGLENGWYKLSAWTSGGGGENFSEIFAENGSGQKFSQTFTNTGWDIWNQSIVNNIEVTDGKLTIGANVEMNDGGGQWGNIDDFMLVKNEDTSLKDLKVNGVTVKNFDPDVTSYDVALPSGTTAIPTVTAVAMNTSATADVTQASALTGHTTVTVTKGSVTKTYVINFTVEDDNPVKNSGFESSFDNWTISDYDAVSLSNDRNSGLKALGYWKATPFELTVSQKITGLKNGVYSLSAWSQGASDSCKNQIFAENSNGNRLTADIKNTGWAIWSKTIINDIVVTDGTLTIGSYLNAPAGYWGSYDDFELIQTSTTIDEKPIINSVVTTPASVTLTPGETKQLTATVDAGDGEDETVTWSSSDTNNKVTVDQSGLVSVAEDAALGDYEIKAVSKADTSKFGTTVVKVVNESEKPNKPNTNTLEIVKQPNSQSVRRGNTAIFSIEVQGTAPFTYQWQKDEEALEDGGNISGANKATLKIDPVTKNDAGKYRCIISDEIGNVTTSSAVTLNVRPKSSSGGSSTNSSSSSNSSSTTTTNATIPPSAPTVILSTNVDGTVKLTYNNGQPVTGWKQINGNWYLADAAGTAKTGWQLVNDKWYLMAPTGVMQTGWQQISGKWYLLDNSGAMLIGWQEAGSKWYLLNNDGTMLTDWQHVNAKWYYLYTSGEMASNTAIDGYTLGSDGAWIQ
jgi:arabinogalactan endo-1,4-beta-galactosidase